MTQISNQQGIVHHLILPLTAVVLVVGGTFIAVSKANHHTNNSVNVASKQSATPNKLANSAAKEATATPVADAPVAAASTTASTTSKSTTTTATSATTSKPKTTTPSAPAPSSPPTTTPLSTLTAIVASLQNGGSAQVTNSSVDVAGPISTAHARPIVFTLSGKIYYAYTQGSAPNFNTSASQTAGTMAIVSVSTPAASGPAHLDKINELVDTNLVAVGFSSGGN